MSPGVGEGGGDKLFDPRNLEISTDSLLWVFWLKTFTIQASCPIQYSHISEKNGKIEIHLKKNLICLTFYTNKTANFMFISQKWAYQQKRVYLEMAENWNLRQACSSKNHRHVLRSKREDPYFIEEKEKLGQPVVNKESIGGKWECKVWWLFIGWVATISHWLGCCQARRKSSFLLWGFQSSNLPLGDERQVSSCLGSAERKK